MITGIFGLPGSGKSTFLSMLAQQYLRKGYRVFVNSDFPIEGCYLYDWSDIGVYDMSNSVVLIDEVSLFADNRDFKNFNKVLKQFFILHRHYHIDIIWCTQQYDGVDRKIRELTRQMYYIRQSNFGISYAIALERIMYVPSRKDLRNNANADISPKWVKVGFFKLLMSPVNKSLRLCWRPRWYRYFDSFTAPKLLPKRYFYFKNGVRSIQGAGAAAPDSADTVEADVGSDGFKARIRSVGGRILRVLIQPIRSFIDRIKKR